MTFSQVCDENIDSSADPGNQVHLPPPPLRGPRRARGGVRRSLKPCSTFGMSPARRGEKGEFIPLDEEEREQAIVEIQKVIPSFDYDALLAQLKDREVLKAKFEDTNVGYEKVQIFRIASALDPDRLRRRCRLQEVRQRVLPHRERVRDAAEPARVRCGPGACRRFVCGTPPRVGRHVGGILRLRLWPGMARNSDSAAHSARAFVRVAVELTMPMATFHSLGA